MFRYLALAWPTINSEAEQRAVAAVRRITSSEPAWSVALDTPGLVVFYMRSNGSSCDVRPLPNQSGTVLGAVFDKPEHDSPQRELVRERLSEGDANKIVSSHGEHLIRQFWGRYVAFVKDPTSGLVWVLRDPLGGLACFHIAAGNAHIVFSHMDDCVRFELGRFSLDWDAVAQRTVCGPLVGRQTCVKDVREVHPGERIYLHLDVRSKLLWHPAAIISEATYEVPAIAAPRMRSLAMACIRTWASRYDNVIHRLSGGLDSSIVAGFIANSTSARKIYCVNYFHTGSSHSDERRFASAAAHKVGYPLLEIQRTTTGLQFSDLLQSEVSPNPARNLAHLETLPHERKIAEDATGSVVVFSGDGGDSLFCSHEKQLAVTDFVWNNGLRWPIVKLALGIAPLVNTAFLRLLSTGIVDGVLRRRVPIAMLSLDISKLMDTDIARQAITRYNQNDEWFRPNPNIPPCKLVQMDLALMTEELGSRPFNCFSDPEEVHPLRSQPLVELCLQIPTYTHLYNGRDRGLAREAFQHDVPDLVAQRTWKGGSGNLAKQVLIHNLPFLRALLLDGQLVRQGILNKAAMESALSGRISQTGAYAMELFDYAIVESWLQTWSQVRVRAAA